MALNEVIARLSVVLGLDTAAFTTGSGRARREATALEKSFAGLKRIGTAVAGAFVATGVVDIANAFKDAGKAAIESAGGLGEQAKALGVSTDALQQFRFMATQTGLDLGQVDTALGQFSKRLGAAELKGKGPFVTALEQIGLTLDDLKGKSETDQIALIADGIAKAGSEAQRSALQVEFFGKSGQSMATLLGEGAAGIKAYADEAKRLGVVLTEGEIAKADETADKLAKLQFVIEAQKNKKLLENSEAIVAYEEALGNLKLTAISAIGGLEGLNQRYNAWALEFNASLRRAINGVVEYFRTNVSKFVTVGKEIVAGLAQGIRNAPGAVWDALKGVITSGIANAKALLGIRSPSRVFMEIGEFIGQGLAIGIEGGESQVAAATRKLTEAARKAAEQTKELFARLFPEVEAYNRFKSDKLLIENSGRSDEAKDAAGQRLLREHLGTDGSAPLSFAPEDAMPPVGLVNDKLDDLMEKLTGLRTRAAETTVRVAKSFKDMADETLDALGRLTGAIKGGGFLNILQAVLGLGLQLGSIGAFGKKIADRVNTSIPGRAAGGPVLAGRPYLVGERGPELVVPRQNATVIPNHALGGSPQRVEVVPSPYFDVVVDGRVQRAAPGIAGAGAQMAAAGAARSRKWALG